MKIIHSLGSLTSIGGVAPVIISLQRELCAMGMHVKVVDSGRGSQLWGRAFRAALLDQIHAARPDVIHDHGVWLPTNHSAVTVAKAHNIPCIISTHGMLERSGPIRLHSSPRFLSEVSAATYAASLPVGSITA